MLSKTTTKYLAVDINDKVFENRDQKRSYCRVEINDEGILQLRSTTKLFGCRDEQRWFFTVEIIGVVFESRD